MPSSRPPSWRRSRWRPESVKRWVTPRSRRALAASLPPCSAPGLATPHSVLGAGATDASVHGANRLDGVALDPAGLAGRCVEADRAVEPSQVALAARLELGRGGAPLAGPLGQAPGGAGR